MSEERFCQHCAKPIPDYFDKRKRFCNNTCRASYGRVLGIGVMGMEAFKPIQRKLGGIGELTVCADLLRSGFSVFRAVADHEDCDVVAMRGKQCWRVEVKTCRYGANGKIYHPKVDPEKCDVIAAVDHYGRITYIPPLDQDAPLPPQESSIRPNDPLGDIHIATEPR